MISVGTIARFDSDRDIGLLNLIKLLKALDLEEKLDLLIPDPQERPSRYIDNYTPKQRVRKRKKNDNDWKWGAVKHLSNDYLVMFGRLALQQ